MFLWVKEAKTVPGLRWEKECHFCKPQCPGDDRGAGTHQLTTLLPREHDSVGIFPSPKVQNIINNKQNKQTTSILAALHPVKGPD